MAGVFIVQAVGFVLSVVVYFTKRQRQWLYFKIGSFFRAQAAPRNPVPGMLDASSIEQVAQDEAAVELAAVSEAMAELTARLASIHNTATARRRTLLRRTRRCCRRAARG